MLVSQYNLPVNFAGQVAIVTGAGRGMGRAVALGLAELGAKVVVAELDETSGNDAAEAIRSSGGEAVAVAGDVSQGDQVRMMFKTAVDRLGTVDILVNNAGIGIAKPLLEYTEDDWDRQLGVNLKGLFFATQEADRKSN